MKAILVICICWTYHRKSKRAFRKLGLLDTGPPLITNHSFEVWCRFNTIGVSDGISMGTDGMSFSLQSRDLIADSIETVMRAQWYDGLVALPGTQKMSKTNA